MSDLRWGTEPRNRHPNSRPLFGAPSNCELAADGLSVAGRDLGILAGAVASLEAATGDDEGSLAKALRDLSRQVGVAELALRGAASRLAQRESAERRARDRYERKIAMILEKTSNAAVADGETWDPTGYFVYTLFDVLGSPIYVGESSNVMARVGTHIQSREYGHRIRSVRLVRCSSEATMHKLEAQLIVALDPPLNIKGRRRRHEERVR